MRNLVLALVLVNLAFFAYAAWIDPPNRSRSDSRDALPRLLLASEFPHSDATPASPAPPESSGGTNVAQCVAVGPFYDPADASKAAATFKQRGFEPSQRGEPGEIAEGFWVHVENIGTAAEEARLMRELQQAQLSDASPVQSADQTRHISVGIFSDQGRAERRASAVKRLGIDAQVSPRTRPGTVYWIELPPKADKAADTSAIAMDGVPAPKVGTLLTRACGGTAPVSPSTVRR
jgi:hypothetical protein